MAQDLATLKEEVRSRSDIVDVIGSYVTLKRAGATYKACCPFHNEKTPSFNVDPRKQMYHCFGCGKGGDVFNFVMEYENLEFMVALERLADRCGVPFEYEGRGVQKGPKKDRLYELHKRATRLFQEILAKDAMAAEARAYLKQRQLDTPLFHEFGIGFATDSFDTLLKWARGQGFSEEELEASGLFSERENPQRGDRLYDRFRGRIMFPIRDELGRVIGFSGRILNKEASPAKYVNSPETLLFRKSAVLYGIDRARKEMASTRQAVLCEGQVDVIRCHEAGVVNAVAAQGTAVTDEHARILKRYADEVFLLLDADAAGVKAALRSAENLLSAGLSIRVARLPDGEDPDSLVLRKGPEALRALLAAADPFVDFQTRVLMEAEPSRSEAARLRVARAVMETVGFAKEAVQREALLKRAAECLNLSESALREDLQTRAVQAQARPKAPHPVPVPTPARMPQVAVEPGKKMPPQEALALELLCNMPELLPQARPHLVEHHFSHPKAKALYLLLAEVQAASREELMDRVRSHPLQPLVNHLIMNHRELIGEDDGPEGALRQHILALRLAAMEREHQNLQHRMRQAEGEERSELEIDSWQLLLVMKRLQSFRHGSGWDEAVTILEMYP